MFFVSENWSYEVGDWGVGERFFSLFFLWFYCFLDNIFKNFFKCFFVFLGLDYILIFGKNFYLVVGICIRNGLYEGIRVVWEDLFYEIKILWYCVIGCCKKIFWLKFVVYIWECGFWICKIWLRMILNFNLRDYVNINLICFCWFFVCSGCWF